MERASTIDPAVGTVRLSVSVTSDSYLTVRRIAPRVPQEPTPVPYARDEGRGQDRIHQGETVTAIAGTTDMIAGETGMGAMTSMLTVTAVTVVVTEIDQKTDTGRKPAAAGNGVLRHTTTATSDGVQTMLHRRAYEKKFLLFLEFLVS